MITKPDDVLYCNVDHEKIKNADPKIDLEILGYYNLYLTERHEIYKRKEIEKLPQPWTDDEVLRNYRFTNVRRELDRESKWLIKNISTNPKLSLEEKMAWSILFRSYNKSSTFEILGFPDTLDILNITDSDLEEVRTKVLDYTKKNPKYVWFTNAFNTGGIRATWAFPESRMYECTSGGKTVEVQLGDGSVEQMTFKTAKKLASTNDKIVVQGLEKNMVLRMIHLIKWVVNSGLITKLNESGSQLDCYNTLLEVPGFARFLGYQVFVDLTYIPEFKFSENEFTISGPGCSRGLRELFIDSDGLNDEELLFWVRDNIQRVFEENGLEYDPESLFDHLNEEDRCLNVMMVENSFCEISKIVKAKKGVGRPRNGYRPTETKKLF